MQQRKTYFEQIPVRVVKELAVVCESSLEKTTSILSTFGTQALRTDPYSFTIPAWYDSDLISTDDPMESKLAGFTYPEWQEPYRDALVELDKSKLEARISAAESAMHRRLQEISGPAHGHELQAIEDAMAMLRALKQSELSG